MWCSGTREFNGWFGFLNATICERRKLATSVTKSTSFPKTGSSYCCPFEGPQTPIRSVWRCAVAGSRCASRCATTRRVLGDAAIIWWWRPKKRKSLQVSSHQVSPKFFWGVNLHSSLKSENQFSYVLSMDVWNVVHVSIPSGNNWKILKACHGKSTVLETNHLSSNQVRSFPTAANC